MITMMIGIDMLFVHAFAAMQTLPFLPAGSLFIIAALGILAILIVAAIVYGLSGVVNSASARAWSRAQIYEALLSALMLILFVALVLIFFVSPIGSFTSIGLNPSNYGCQSAVDLYQLSTCDLAIFDSNAFGAFDSVFTIATYLGMSSGVAIKFDPFGALPTNLAGGAGMELKSIFPVGAEDLLGFMFSAILVVVLLNQIQLLILAGALLWLGFFITLGLIARSFGFTRTFGGTMIAIGLGLGFVFPLSMAITYGFLDTQVVNLGCAPNLGGCTGTLFNSLAASFVGFISGSGLPSGPWIFQLAILGAGLTFIPFLNFTLVETFIVDFSKAIGEKIDFSFILNI